MLPHHPHICLYQPEIPQNTGNIARLAAATASRLHLIRPFGFDAASKNLRRPGLDYWPYLDLEIHDSLEELFGMFHESRPRVAFFSKLGTKPYTAMPTDTELLVFGRETTGLPRELFERYPDDFYQIPMFHPGVRSLNLANAVSIGVYHLLGSGQP
jgi:tRNA (cytidine/uridine-2'-O-)-methyltransferase